MSDQVYLLLPTPTKYSVSKIIEYMKRKRKIMIFERRANLKYKFGNRHFWTERYYAGTVILNTATIQKYIREQEKDGKFMDNLKSKEYIDLFKGSK